jgi:glutathione S-transferase
MIFQDGVGPFRCASNRTNRAVTYELAIGDHACSTWSLRGWLLFDAFNLPVRTRFARLDTDDLPRVPEHFCPARTVPVMRTPEGTVAAESLASAEELASRHPEAGIWPKDPTARAVARVLAAGMHAGFAALRSHCPMNLRVSYTDCAPPDAVLADLARLETI